MPPLSTLIDREIHALGESGAHLVLAVSGGIDSMVLLDRAGELIAPERLVVATFDHGTGAAAQRAAEHVEREARVRGLAIRRGRGDALQPSEAAWRAARWTFLRLVAEEWRAASTPATAVRIVTAHTADDQAETVLMRAMRGAGARGLAGLLVATGVARPFVRVPRAALAQLATERGLTWEEDPANASMRHHRNRLRHDILPALEQVRPGFREWLSAVAEDAAAWRAEMDAVAEHACPSTLDGTGGLSVAASRLVGYDAASLAVLWASVAGRVGLALDQRGTHRLAAFTIAGKPGDAMPLSGGWQVVRGTGRFTLAHVQEPADDVAELSRDGTAQWGRWRFVPAVVAEPADRWSATLPAGLELKIRHWRPADRIALGTGSVRVKRVLTEAGIAAADRVGWPVVVADDAIVWIPGVSRVLAATARSGRPGVCIRCEPSDG